MENNAEYHRSCLDKFYRKADMQLSSADRDSSEGHATKVIKRGLGHDLGMKLSAESLILGMYRFQHDVGS